MKNRLPSWSRQLKIRHGGVVRKIALDTGAGCPNRDGLYRGGCLFCDSRGGGSGAFLEGRSLEEQILSGLAWIRKRHQTDRVILYFQSYSATYAPFEVFRKQTEEALTLARGAGAQVMGLSVGTRPDLVDDDILDYLLLLKRSGLEIWLELGIQTLDDTGLRYLRRGHDSVCSLEACARARSRGIDVCAHLIAGIPGERHNQLALSAERLSREGARGFKFHPLHVLAHTELEKLYLRGEFLPPSLEDYIETLAEALEVLGPQREIQRLTADARSPHLIAPQWIADKARVLQSCEKRLDRPVAPLIRLAGKEEAPALSETALRSFRDTVAPLYEERGRETFANFASPAPIARRFEEGSVFFAAIRREQVRAMAELRPPAHLAMLFVDGDERGQGTGRALIEAVKDAIVSTPSLLQRSKSLTVNASPNSVSFYRRQGFIGEGEKQADGIRFVPMTLDIP